MQRRTRRRWTKHPRRGSAYLMTLGVSLVVSLLGLTALQTLQIQRKQAEHVADVEQAQINARTALDMALYRAAHDSAWRTKLKDGTWAGPLSAGRGTYELAAIDETDGDLTNNSGDPVTIVGTGRYGSARHKLQLKLAVLIPGIDCLQSPLHAHGDLDIVGGSVRADEAVSSNDDIELSSGAHLRAAAEASDEIRYGSGGGTYHGTTSAGGGWTRAMPSSSSMYDYYLNNGTSISIYDLPTWDKNWLTNTQMDSGTTGWSVHGTASLASDTSQYRSWSRSLLVSGRTSTSAGPSQTVTTALESGESYVTEAWIRVPNSSFYEDSFRVTLRLVSTGSGTQDIALTSWQWVERNTWVRVSGSSTVSWSGELTSAVWRIESQNKSTEFRVDDVELKINNAPSGWRTIHRTLLSPASNPFGAGTTNASGIYIINCGGARVSIRNSRIEGTLVLLNQDSSSRLQGSVYWKPASYSANPSVVNLPALLTNNSLTIATGTTGLSESTANCNFNSTGTPYADVTDGDKLDSYPSTLNGLFYVGGSLTVTDSPVLQGVLVGGSGITVQATDFRLTYDPVYFDTNAPPGFRKTSIVMAVPGSYQQVVD